MMLTKEECENKLNNLKKLQKEINKNCKLNSVANSVFIGSVECFEYLIKEQFDNQPLSFEELEVGKCYWNEKEKEWMKIYQIKIADKNNSSYSDGTRLIKYGSRCWQTIVYEDNVFYRKEVQE